MPIEDEIILKPVVEMYLKAAEDLKGGIVEGSLLKVNLAKAAFEAIILMLEAAEVIAKAEKKVS